MRDPIRDLENFHPEGTPVNPMPASEVRRRGDRMRRRNHALATVGGVAAALVAVAVPLTVVNGDEPGRELQPAPPATEWRQEVPERFPLDAGLTGGTRDGTEMAVPDACGTPFWSTTGATDVAEASAIADPESYGARALAVYPDQASAEQALAAIRAAAADCPEEPESPDDTTLVYDVLDRDLGTEDSLVLVEEVRFDDGLVADTTVTLVGRTGNALLLDQAYTSAGGDEVVEQMVRNRQELGADPWSAMCVFDADPCDLETVLADEEPTGSASGAIPDGFPLAAGYPTTSEGPGMGPVEPTRSLAPLQPEACGAVAAVGNHTDLVRAGWSGPEDARERQLVTFGTEQQAEEYLRSVLAIFDDCFEVTEGDFTRLTQVVTDVSGVGDSTGGAITRFEMDGAPVPGLETLVVVRVGNAVLLSTAATEGGAGPNPAGEVQDSFNRVLEQASPVIDAMRGL